MPKFDVDADAETTILTLGGGRIRYNRATDVFRFERANGAPAAVEIKGSLATDGKLSLGGTVSGETGPTADRPPDPTVGTYYFDSDLGLPIWYDGTEWIDATGSSV